MSRTVHVKELVFILFVVFAFRTEIAANERPDSFAQTHFSAEDSGVKHPVSIPDSVLTVLKQDEGVRIALESEGVSAENIPPSWFSASAIHLIHLSDSKDLDLVVVGEEALRGSNVTTFWVFHATPSGYKLILTAPAHDLILKSNRSKGLRDIELTSITAVQVSRVLLRFDGTRYMKGSATSKAIE